MKILSEFKNYYGEACYLLEDEKGNVTEELAAEVEMWGAGYAQGRPVFFKDGDGTNLSADNLTQDSREVEVWKGTRRRKVVCTHPVTGDVLVYDSIKGMAMELGLNRGAVSVSLFNKYPMGKLNVRYYWGTLEGGKATYLVDGVPCYSAKEAADMCGSSVGSLYSTISMGRYTLKGKRVKKL